MSIDVPPGNLSASTIYYWRVRHQDNNDDWSEWSDETLFVTAASGGGCGVSTSASATDITFSFGLLGFLSVSGVYVGQRQKKRKSK